MSDDASDTKKALVLPIAHNEKGDFRGLVLDENGVRPSEFRRIEEGKPIIGDFVSVTPREGSHLLDAEFTRMPGSPRPPEGEARPVPHQGPAKVNSRAYCDGWERIFGRGKKADIPEA
jgi:hypothetical protein